MRFINSPVRNASLENVFWYCNKPVTIAAMKKIGRKQNRARISQFVRQKIIQEHLSELAEIEEQYCLAKQTAFYELMQKAMSKKKPGRRQSTSTVCTARVEVRIQQPAFSGEGQFAVLASCAMSEYPVLSQTRFSKSLTCHQP